MFTNNTKKEGGIVVKESEDESPDVFDAVMDSKYNVDKVKLTTGNGYKNADILTLHYEHEISEDTWQSCIYYDNISNFEEEDLSKVCYDVAINVPIDGKIYNKIHDNDNVNEETAE